MNDLKKFILCVLLASSQCVYSATECDTCFSETACDLCGINFCDMEFTAYIDALYWHVCNGEMTQFIDQGENIHLTQDYNWGWRIGGIAYWKSWDFGFRYTFYSGKNKEQFSDNMTFVEYDIAYKIFDIEVGKTCCFFDKWVFRPFFGGKYAWIDMDHMLFEGTETISHLSHDSCGLYMGVGTRWQLCSLCVCDRDIPMAIVSRFNTGLMDADFKQENTNSEGENNERHEECLFVPNYEVYFGLEFRMCDLCEMDGFFQLGYEAQYWGWRKTGSSDDITYLGLGGMVLRFGAHF